MSYKNIMEMVDEKYHHQLLFVSFSTKMTENNREWKTLHSKVENNKYVMN